MVVLVAAFFFMGFFSIYVRRCTGRRFHGDDFHFEHFAGGRWSISDPPGLDAEIIDSFPTFLFSSVKGLKIGKGGVECAVCICEFEDHEMLRLIPKCSHVFHPKCIDAWLASHVTCPVCRANLNPVPLDRYSSFFPFPDSDRDVHPSEPDRAAQQSGSGVVVDRVDDDHLPQISVRADHHHHQESIQNQNNGFDEINLSLPHEQVSVPVPVGSQKKQSGHSRTGSSGWSFRQLFPRSHSTGHSLVQSGEDPERFTLRLPEDVRSRLLSTELNRTRSCVVFTRARSGRRGFRSEGEGAGGAGGRPSKISSSGSYDRFDLDQEDRSVRKGSAPGLPPLPPKNGSGPSRGKRGIEGGNEDVGGSLPRRSSRSVRSSFDRFLLGLDTNYTANSNQKPIGERSFDRLRGDSSSQV
ncbi:unnamed protein product [Linum tenue]|uniref:RING-type E3 ubiquitin transferase n=2 Tax=Linum tenue TaxID=586396 RepID=A0AAV0MM95_9ROSI|nr:unnamed protein product [Linum tenue]